jgi:hypothetical protein
VERQVVLTGMMKEMLEALGFTVTEKTSSEEARKPSAPNPISSIWSSPI